MIETQNLRKTFKVSKKRASAGKSAVSDPRQQGNLFHAVHDVTFKCEAGSILGILGPNGAGKTTTLRLLSTALKPSAGRILIDGEDFSRFPHEIRRRIGFLSGTTGVYHRLTAREMVAYFGQLHGIPRKTLDQRIDELFDRFDMHSFSNERNDKLSSGMRQRVNIVRTLIHDPPILILDEPTTGLDIMASRTILDCIRECREKKRTVVFSTHHLYEIEALCDEIVVIHQGVSRFNGKPAELRAQYRENSLADAFLKCIEVV